MTTPERPYTPEDQEERIEQERVAAVQGETEYRDSGSAEAQNTPGPETQTEN